MPGDRQGPDSPTHNGNNFPLDVLKTYGLDLTEDGVLRWEPNTPQHPRNWKLQRKLFDTSLIMFLDFFTTAVSTAGTSASQQAHKEYDIGSTLALFAFVSIYLLGQGLGGIFFPPLSESFGRKKLYVGSTILWTLFCLMIAAVPSISAVFVGRFFTGALSAIPSIVVAGSIEDLFKSESRVWLVFAWLTTANWGLVVGSVLGPYVAYSIGWRWIFYISAAVTGIVTVLLMFIEESRPSQLLKRQVSLFERKTGHQSLRIQNPDQVPDLNKFLQLTLIRPLRLLFTEPIVFMVSIMSAIAFGFIYLFTEALQIVYCSYGFSIQQTSLAFIPIGIGFFGGFLTRLYDLRIIKQRERSGRLLRATLSAIFPLFARQMFTRLGANYAGSVLAGIATIACLVPFLLLQYGKRIRKASRFARYSILVYNKNSADGTRVGSAEDLAENRQAMKKSIIADGLQAAVTAEVGLPDTKGFDKVKDHAGSREMVRLST